MTARLASRLSRLSWPIRNEPTLDALKLISHGFDADATRAEWERMLGEQPGGVPLRESDRTGADPQVLTAELEQLYQTASFTRADAAAHPCDHLGVELMYTAHLAANLGHAAADHDQRASWAHRLTQFSTTHLDRCCDEILTDISVRAESTLLAAVPGLIIGYRQALASLANGEPFTVSGRWS